MEGTQDLWMPFKKLEKVIRFTLTRPTKPALLALEECLRKHKQNFLTLLKNQPKNAAHREELNKGVHTGITMPGIGHQILSKELVQETLIISDMYDLNEYMALDLLCTAQMYLSSYPGLTRGLVAILLYYDGRNALTNTLRMLVQARSGVLWTSDASPDVVKFITRFTDQLLADGLFNRIFELLNSLDLSKEIELLQKNRALGGPKHHRQVLDLYEKIRQNLADVVYMWAAQSGLPREPLFALINHLKVTKLEADSSGGIDNITLTLQMGLLYALDLSMLQKNEDEDDFIRKLPLVCDQGLIDALIQELTPDRCKWESEGLQALSIFAWGLSLATLRLSFFATISTGATEQADVLVDYAIQMRVFDFLHRVYLENKVIFNEEFYIRRLHILITDFIVLMHSKVKDLRIRADETARTIQQYTQEGVAAPANLPQYYQNLLLAIAKLYSKDTLNLKLILDYWNSIDTSAPSRSTSRAISLFKFVRQAGELLPPILFVPYLKMLSSLASCSQAARHTFNLLKQNGPGNSSAISWDHFFNSLNQYYASLRQEQPSQTDTMYSIRTHCKGITPLELDGLHCVLLLIRTVATHDEFARIALCEHPGWAPLSVLLGLVSCSVPIPLKADLLITLAALAKSPETASQLWNNLEASQIIVTVPSTSSYQPRGVKTELEEIEARMEEYPLTIGLLKLLNVLTSSGVPRTLGVGIRKPGFDPYLTIIIDSIFIKFNSRSYKNIEEKWEIANLCLELFVKFLSQYDPQASDFAGLEQKSEANLAPGFHIMLQLNSKTELLRLVLFILFEGTRLLDTYATFAGKKQLETTTLLCLKLLDQCLQLQPKFFSFVTSSGCAILLTKLNKLLLGMNPGTGKPDHLLYITKYVTYNDWLDEHAMYAVKILLVLTTSVSVSNHLLGILSAEPIGLEIISGFVECMNADDDEEYVENPTQDDSPKIKSNTKLCILKLLKQCLSLPAPNLSHYLFGFNIKSDIKSTVFQQPGVMGFPFTCLHALFAILNKFLKNKSDGITCNGNVIESAYAMLYYLCANPHTSEPVLRFIRLKHDFLEKHIEALPLNTKCDATTLNQISWLLKMVAIEIKISSESNHISQLNSLIRLCLGHSQKPISINTDIDMISNKEVNKSINRLVDLLNNLKFERGHLPTPEWDESLFDSALMEKLLVKCEHTLGGIRLINIKKLHRILMDELGTLQGGAVATQKQLIVKQFEKVLMYAIKYNNTRNEVAASVRFMESWKQIVEILFITVPTDVLNLHSRQTFLVQMLHSLLCKFVPAHITTELGNIISESVLMLFVCLRHSYIMEGKQIAIQNTANQNTNITLYSSTVTLQHILRKIAEWIIVSEVTAQKIRINLYGALLHSINILNVKHTADLENKRVHGSNYVNRLDNSKYRFQEPLILLDELSNFGEKLFDILCHDCTGGHDVSKMLSLATIDSMIEMDSNNERVKFLCLRGYLKHIIDSLLESDNKLRGVLDSTPETLRPLYLYESKMTVLCRIAMTRSGAQVLLEQKILGCLATMRVFDYHPEIKQNTNTLDTDLLPSIEKRYHQIFFPLLMFCDAVITSLGSENQSSSVQILHCLISHSETIELILRSGNPGISTGALKELALLTGVIARVTNHNTNMLLANLDGLGDNTAFFTRIQKLMLALYPRFVLIENDLRHVAGTSNEIIDEKSMRLLNCLQISCHLALYARNCIVGHGVEHRSSNVIFPPTLIESPTNEYRHQYNKVVDQSPGLGIVIKQLMQSVKHYDQVKVALGLLTDKMGTISNMNSTDLKDFIPNLSDKMNIMDCRILANEVLKKQLHDKQKEMKFCKFLIENSLYLIWAHLDYYMLRAIPKSAFPRFSGNTSTFGESALESASEVSWKVTANDVYNLKQNLVGVFNETFSKKLVATAQEQTEANRGFIEALLRRIKRLIQFVPVH
ncbi:nuclear pore complex protein Nup205 [Chrysoperla carnea]|uniref:nuclear pore complex protein Nup205 n=1 Tax=Chrysoperla carnea TaxID=189513 RepID=UPI001D06507A|nr:nuclear pore complex protein Nup205 [Chrysoperla carnea]